MSEIYQPEKTESPIFAQLREAFNSRDINKLRLLVDYIQRMLQEGSKAISSEMTDNDLRELFNTGVGTIYVGSGTAGQRVYVERNKIFMPPGDERSERYGKYYRDKFRYLFNLSQEDELLVNF